MKEIWKQGQWDNKCKCWGFGYIGFSWDYSWTNASNYIEDLVTLVPTNIILEQMQANVDVGGTSVVDADKIEVDLQKNHFDDRIRKCSSEFNVEAR